MIQVKKRCIASFDELDVDISHQIEALHFVVKIKQNSRSFFRERFMRTLNKTPSDSFSANDNKHIRSTQVIGVSRKSLRVGVI